MKWTRIFVEASLIVVAAVVLGAGWNLLAPNERRLAWLGKYATPTQALAYSAPSSSTRETDFPAGTANPEDPKTIAPPKDPGRLYLEISGEIVRRLHRGGALFIDARRSEAYEEGHIEGARSIAVWERDADAKVAALPAQKVPFEQVIVLYCSGGDCQDSVMLAEKLTMAGFYNLYVYKDGFPDWENKGWPVRRGKTP